MADVHFNDTPEPASRNREYISPQTGDAVYCVDATLDGETMIERGRRLGGVVLCGPNGEEALVVDGQIRAVAANGLPVVGYSASTMVNTYGYLCSVPRECNFACVYVKTNNVIVSLNGGICDHLFGIAGMAIPYAGLKIPAGSAIYVRNAAAGSNYADVYVALW